MAGYPTTRADIDSRAGTLTVQLRNLLDEIERFHDWLGATPDATLTGAPVSYTETEVAQLKSAFADLARLARIYRGVDTQAQAYDFGTFAKLLAGVL